MTEKIDGWVNDIHEGDAKDVLREMPESSVHMAMTSPPYYGLRDYGADGQIGLEESVAEYIQNLIEVFQELRRVLRSDGSLWLNLGDSYAGSGGAGGQWTEESSGSAEYAGERKEAYNGPLNAIDLPRKNKMQVPARVAIALQEDGWILRNRVAWVKPNPMPQSVKDRLNETTEAIFHLVPNSDYWYDLDAIRESHQPQSFDRRERHDTPRYGPDETGMRAHSALGDGSLHPAGKNPGDVFEVTVQPFPEAHFAVYPPELVEKPIKATAPPKVCAKCGRGWERRRETVERPDRRDRDKQRREYDGNTEDQNNRISWVGTPKDVVDEWWELGCDCDTDESEPGIVLDPFAGAGTTALEAKRLGRRFIGIELNPEYVAMAQKRVGIDVDQPELLLDENEQSLKAFANGGQE